MESRSIIPTRSLLGGFDDFFATPFMTDSLATPFLTYSKGADSILRRSSPGYEIVEDDKNYQLAIDVPGVKAADMNVELRRGGRVLNVSGGRKRVTADSVSETKFEKSFTIDSSVDTSKISANLADGVLVIKAPKNTDHDLIQKVAISEEARDGAMLDEASDEK